MPQSLTMPEAPPALSSVDPAPMPDELSEVMVATASDYFLGGGIVGGEQPSDFRRTFQNIYDYKPYLGRVLLAAGLLAAGFTIEVDPTLVSPPSIPVSGAEEALNKTAFFQNYHNIALTIIDMGIDAISRDHPSYDERIAAFVISVG